MDKIVLDSIDDVPFAAQKIIEYTDKHRIVAFYGSMGAGKTTLIREIAAQLGVADTVTSPTFAIVNNYLTDGGGNIYHFDFYRIESIAEALDMGYEEYFDSGDLCLVEWPEKIEELIPGEALKVYIDIVEGDDDGRIITIP